MASASGVAVHGCSKTTARVVTMIAAKRHLEDRRDHRRQAAHVAPRVDRAGGVAERRAEDRQLAGQRRLVAGQPRARDDDHADEPDEQADQAVDPDGLVRQEDGREHDREQRDRGRQDRRERRLDRGLGPGDEQERDRDVDDRHHEQVAVDPALARERLLRDPDDDPEQRGADQQAERHEREGPEVVDRELDEQVARAPDEPEREEDDPVDPVGAVLHRRMIPLGWPTSLGQYWPVKAPDADMNPAPPRSVASPIGWGR